MAVQHYPVEVQSDYLEKITRAKPVQALSELIWNSFDADATQVSVTFNENDLGTLSRIVVRDNGLGMPLADAPGYFRKLGGSWKKNGGTTPSGRALHGQEGRGRFKAFALGVFADWKVVYERGGRLWSYTIAMSSNNIKTIDISDEEEAEAGVTTGVTLTISEMLKHFRGLETRSALEELTEIFAIYLSDYQGLSARVGGQLIDPSKAIKERKAFNLADIVSDGKIYPARLEIVEWNGINQRALYLCNDKRFPLLQATRRFHVGAYQFSAYLSSSCLTAAQKAGTIGLAEMQPPIIAAMDEAQSTIKAHFRERAAQEATTFVEEWKAEKIYPYVGEPSSQVEQIERQVFDIVALNVARNIPEFAEAPTKNKQFQLRMLRQAIERSPDDLQLILNEVLNLPQRKRDELAGLLQNVTLSSIISSAKVVADRLKFLLGLEAVLFDEEPKKRLKERTQLHRIIAENCWLFGEEFSLSVDDRSLTEVLRAHRKFLDNEIVIDEPVKHITKTRGIVDLMLSKLTRRHRANEVTHLVVELKRPSVTIDFDEVGQIERYAFSVANDERFKAVGVNWVFWVISDSYGSFAEQRITDKVTGLIHRNGNISIFVKTWAQVLDENKARMQFFQQHLEFQADKGEALKHLQERHAQYLEGVFNAGDTEGEPAETSETTVESA